MSTFKKIKQVLKNTDLIIIRPNFQKFRAVVTYKDGPFLLRFTFQYESEMAMIHDFTQKSPISWCEKLRTELQKSFNFYKNEV